MELGAFFRLFVDFGFLCGFVLLTDGLNPVYDPLSFRFFMLRLPLWLRTLVLLRDDLGVSPKESCFESLLACCGS